MKRKLRSIDEIELENIMSSLGDAVESACEILNLDKPKFCLVIFDNPEVSHCISNCKKEDIINSMYEVTMQLRDQENVGVKEMKKEDKKTVSVKKKSKEAPAPAPAPVKVKKNKKKEG